MARGFCFKCDRPVGGFRDSPAWQCPSCRKLYCEKCPKRKVGLLFKKPVCPECRTEMRK